MDRRKFMTSCVAATTLPALAIGQTNKKYRWTSVDLTALNQALVELERTSRGRIGVGLLDTASGQVTSYRGDERFLMLSTFKTLAAAYILARSDQGVDKLTRRMSITDADILEYAPVTRRHIGPQGMTLAELCHATITTSDNTAANLMHRSYGGPQALTQFIRSLGDTVTRHDRYEPELNKPNASEPMDTTSPNAMTSTLNTLLFGTALKPESRQLLQSWLKANTTGDRRLRAGIPPNWIVGEKTGTASIGANDAGFVQAPGGAAVIASVYLETDAIAGPERDQIIATVGKRVADLMR
ncbi:class A beta-lactamase [Pollutimonas harenae]|uniref:Beta-lactamase n=1 Tax=Pollutimonas harenae TaxID=657015 RepID=A0A853GST9_9BURK|nr:class A beta-lactamase [Pollutimonas harenae]NYT85227.1 class A beta-lactamase [Pollutimonas harenae]TEA72402.1 class A beta-lactamase [Pollutimonas harenae]